MTFIDNTIIKILQSLLLLSFIFLLILCSCLQFLDKRTFRFFVFLSGLKKRTSGFLVNIRKPDKRRSL